MTALRVLLAEDEPAVAASLEQQLTALGHRVIAEAATGREAVALAAGKKPDVVIMDIMMPDCDGITAAHSISEHSPLPIVFLTGHFEEELVAGASASGGLAYLLKPATSEQLQAALSLAHRRFSELQDLREQVSRLEEALEARKAISRAKGILMQRHGLSEEEAHRRLQKEASRSQSTVAELARAILRAEPVLHPDGNGGSASEARASCPKEDPPSAGAKEG
jgi:AmiR/NasT family two-component response regulator